MKCRQCQKEIRKGREHNGLCIDCYINAGQSTIHSYSYKPDPVFFKKPWENTLYYGIELETESNDPETDYLEIAQNIQRDYPVYLKHDGSLEGDSFEIVTHPATYQGMKDAINWYELLKLLDYEDFTSHDNGRCGLHIHLSKAGITDLTLKKMLFFFYKCHPEMLLFGRRKDNSTTRTYTAPLKEQEIVNMITNGDINADRYRAINLQPSPTVEIRIFRGTLNHKTFTATLQFMEALHDFLLNHSILLMQTKPGKEIFKSFIAYTMKESPYNQLKNYLIERFKLTDYGYIPNKKKNQSKTMKTKNPGERTNRCLSGDERNRAEEIDHLYKSELFERARNEYRDATEVHREAERHIFTLPMRDSKKNMICFYLDRIELNELDQTPEIGISEATGIAIELICLDRAGENASSYKRMLYSEYATRNLFFIDYIKRVILEGTVSKSAIPENVVL